MSLIKDISSGENIKIFQFEKNEEFSKVLQIFLKNLGIKHDLRKNFFNGYSGVARIIPQLKGVQNYTDTVQYAKKDDIEVEIFTGYDKIFVVIHFSEDSEDILNNAIANSF